MGEHTCSDDDSYLAVYDVLAMDAFVAAATISLCPKKRKYGNKTARLLASDIYCFFQFPVSAAYVRPTDRPLLNLSFLFPHTARLTDLRYVNGRATNREISLLSDGTPAVLFESKRTCDSSVPSSLHASSDGLHEERSRIAAVYKMERCIVCSSYLCTGDILR